MSHKIVSLKMKHIYCDYWYREEKRATRTLQVAPFYICQTKVDETFYAFTGICSNVAFRKSQYFVTDGMKQRSCGV